MTIFVKLNPRAGKRWVVQNGAGRGGRVIRRYDLKRRAVKRGRREARQRGTDLRVQLAQTGQFRTVANYA